MFTPKQQKQITIALRNLNKTSYIEQMTLGSFSVYNEEDGGGYGCMITVEVSDRLTVSFYSDFLDGATVTTNVMVKDHYSESEFDLGSFVPLMSKSMENMKQIFFNAILQSL